jgi:hypothetical protein
MNAHLSSEGHPLLCDALEERKWDFVIHLHNEGRSREEIAELLAEQFHSGDPLPPHEHELIDAALTNLEG